MEFGNRFLKDSMIEPEFCQHVGLSVREKKLAFFERMSKKNWAFLGSVLKLEIRNRCLLLKKGIIEQTLGVSLGANPAGSEAISVCGNWKFALWFERKCIIKKQSLEFSLWQASGSFCDRFWAQILWVAWYFRVQKWTSKYGGGFHLAVPFWIKV